TNLRCEYKTNPLGIDQTKPRFDWQLSPNSDARDQKQTAYQILVASSEDGLKKNEGDLWDTGKLQSDQTTQIAYDGKPLTSEQRAWWKVRTWNEHGEASAWSKPAMFSIGLLNASDWKAKWIGYDAPDTQEKPAQSDAISLEGAPWVWSSQMPGATHLA